MWRGHPALVLTYEGGAPSPLSKMTIARWIIILGYLFLAALPLAWMGITSLKHYDDTISRNARFIPAAPDAQSSDDRPIFPVTLDGCKTLASIQRSSGFSFFHYLVNSIVIAVASTIASVAL